MLTDSGRPAAAGVKHKWAPMHSGTASTSQDLIFLVKGSKASCVGCYKELRAGTEDEFSLCPCLGGLKCKSLTHQCLHF